MTDTITWQVSEQVQRAMEATNAARPLPNFDYVPTTGCEPFHRRACVPSPHHTESEREASRSNWSGRPCTGNYDRNTDATTRSSGHPVRGQMAKSTTASTPYRPPPITAHSKLHNTRKYYEFHEQNWHTTAECRELKKGLHELADKGQINRFLKKGLCFFCGGREPAQPQPRDEECSTEVVATIAGGYAEGITRSAWKAQLRGAQQVLTIEQRAHVTMHTMVFSGREAPRFTSTHNDHFYRKLHGHFYMGLPKEVDVPRARHCPLGAPHLRSRVAGGESHWYDSPPAMLR
ncbi:hypothetical protein Cgig2_026279 [Carnegiea gigantea]|uniref:Uncharacterized protein n=1 Tax=Carnegiea gigantea TaxID=171969 RepID=A0A9Q1JQQ4_9CARY|nr:hypothetical protein Cgig2_026279 [Carnegiea gigantea]